jgi:hypothetical protein
MQSMESVEAAMSKLSHDSASRGWKAGDVELQKQAADEIEPEPEITLTISVRASAVGLLIGKSGRTLSAMTQASGASIIFQNFSETSSTQYKERCVLIKGTLKRVKEALKHIMIRLQSQLSTSGTNAAQEGGNQPLVQWAIPQSSAGLLIGKQGAGIKHINERSGCWVKIAHPEESLVSGERIVYIRGAADQTKIALEIVKKVAGGRPLVNDESLQSTVQVVLPKRAISTILRGFIMKDEVDTDFDNIIEDFHEVRVEVDKNVFTGLSESVVYIRCDDATKRAEATKVMEDRLLSWKENYVSPDVTPRLAGAAENNNSSKQEEEVEEGGGVATGGTLVVEEEAIHAEMCVIMLVSATADEKLIFPETVGRPDANVFNDILARYACVMDKNLYEDAALMQSPRNKFKRISITGSLRSLIGATVKVSQDLHEQYPTLLPVMDEASTPSGVGVRQQQGGGLDREGMNDGGDLRRQQKGGGGRGGSRDHGGSYGGGGMHSRGGAYHPRSQYSPAMYLDDGAMGMGMGGQYGVHMQQMQQMQQQQQQQGRHQQQMNNMTAASMYARDQQAYYQGNLASNAPRVDATTSLYGGMASQHVMMAQRMPLPPQVIGAIGGEPQPPQSPMQQQQRQLQQQQLHQQQLQQQQHQHILQGGNFVASQTATAAGFQHHKHQQHQLRASSAAGAYDQSKSSEDTRQLYYYLAQQQAQQNGGSYFFPAGGDASQQLQDQQQQQPARNNNNNMHPFHGNSQSRR